MVITTCVALCAAMLFGIAAAPVAAHVQARMVVQPVAILTVISGDVLVRSARGDFSSAMDGAVLYAGAMLRTSADARALITFFEGSTVELDPASDITIEDASARGGTIAQSLGRAWNVVMHLTAADSRYKLLTPAATASVRGIDEFAVVAADRVSGPTTTLTTTEPRVPTTLGILISAKLVTLPTTTVAANTAYVSTRPAAAAERARKVIAQTVAARALLAARSHDRAYQGDQAEN